MKELLQFSLIVVLFVLVRAGDIAIGAALARAYFRAVAYSVVAVLALLYVLLALFLH